MSISAFIKNGKVVIILNTSQTGPGWIDVTTLSPTPAIGDLYENGSFTHPTPSQERQASDLLSRGVTVASASGAWSAVFHAVTDSAGASVWAMILSELAALQMTSGTLFADGSTTVHWPDITSTSLAPSLHPMTPIQFRAFATGLGKIVAQCRNYSNGVTGATLPSMNLIIP